MRTISAVPFRCSSSRVAFFYTWLHSQRTHLLKKGSGWRSREDVDLLSLQFLHGLRDVVRQLLHRRHLEHTQREHPAGQSKTHPARVLSRYALTLASDHNAQSKYHDTVLLGTTQEHFYSE